MWMVFALLAAICAALVTVLSKAGLEKVNPNLAFAVQSILIIIIAWTAAFISGAAKEITKIEGRAWIYLLSAGVLTAFSSLLTFRALKLGDASQVNPLERISLVFAIVLAAIFLKEKITWQIIIGAILMTAGAIIIMLAKKPS